jgi:hypothetical protein
VATVTINNNNPIATKVIERVSFPKTEIVDLKRGIRINSILPFRVRFTAIQIPSGIGNVPAIPLQVIGFSNYIL